MPQLRFRLARFMLTCLAVSSCGGGGGSGGDASPPPAVAFPQFWLEPRPSTTIGVGQTINVHAALKSSSADPYPHYIDASQITWTSSQPGFAAINASGMVAGVNEGETTITARYQTHSSELTVHVVGELAQRSVWVSGQGARAYSLYTPTFDRDVDAHPLILALHGGGGAGMLQAAMTQLNQFAHDQKVYVAYLEGSGLIQTFNAGSCCGSAQTGNVDDVAYVAAVLDDLQANAPIDGARVYATGFSNGAMMTHRLACALSGRLAGIAAVGGGSGQFDAEHREYYACTPARPIRILHIHGVNDRNYPIGGGPGDGLSGASFYPIDATIADWIERNNVTNEGILESITSTTACRRYAHPADPTRPSAPVTLCRVDPPDVYDAANAIVFGGGHSWPGGVRSPASNSDVPVSDFNANAYLWTFFNR
jgi:polyhydroxybutyrate depolymerase